MLKNHLPLRNRSEVVKNHCYKVPNNNNFSKDYIVCSFFCPKKRFGGILETDIYMLKSFNFVVMYEYEISHEDKREKRLKQRFDLICRTCKINSLQNISNYFSCQKI